MVLDLEQSYKEGCDARCKMDLEHKIILDGKLDHNHGPDDERTLPRYT